MLNKVCLIGNVCDTPSVNNMKNGDKVCNFALATNEKWKDKNTGEQKESVEFHKITTFNQGLISVIENYVDKGSKLYIEGKLKTRKWQDQSGQDRYTTEVEIGNFDGVLKMLDSKSDSKSDGNKGPKFSGEDASAKQAAFDAHKPPMEDDFEDTIPF